jgi:hypothetical protein
MKFLWQHGQRNELQSNTVKVLRVLPQKIIEATLKKKYNTMASEKLLEKKLVKAVQEVGGLAVKLIAASFTGLPDRLVLLQGGKVCFVETKSSGKKLKPRQEVIRNLLQRLGFTVWVVDSNESLNEFKKSIKG